MQGYRSPEEQNALFAKGRTVPGNVVTHVQGLFSWHNYGLAFDVVPERLRQQPNWAPEDPLWSKLGFIGKRLGLHWGGDWSSPDKPHFEYHPGLSIQEVRDYFLKTGEVLLSKVLRPEVLIMVLLGVWGFLTYVRSKT